MFRPSPAMLETAAAMLKTRSPTHPRRTKYPKLRANQGLYGHPRAIGPPKTRGHLAPCPSLKKCFSGAPVPRAPLPLGKGGGGAVVDVVVEEDGNNTG